MTSVFNHCLWRSSIRSGVHVSRPCFVSVSTRSTISFARQQQQQQQQPHHRSLLSLPKKHFPLRFCPQIISDQSKFNSYRRHSTNTSDGEDDDNNNEEPKLLYRAPMGDLVTRLKRISITSCLVSIVGLPLLVYLKTGTWPDAKQLGMGGFAFISATGSTLALHFVFGPYVLNLYELPVRQRHNNKQKEEQNKGELSSSSLSSPEQQRRQASQEYMYKATTRSIFGMTQEIVFDPLTDVTRYSGARPFANFVVKDDYVLYCHPELLDEDTRSKLLHPKEAPSSSSEEKEDVSKVRRPIDEEDGFL